MVLRSSGMQLKDVWAFSVRYKAHTPLAIFVLVFIPFALGHFFSYFLRVAPSVLAEPIQQKFDLSNTQMGFTFAAYFLGFTLMQLPLGFALDRYGPRRVQITIYSLAVSGMLLTALAQNYFMLLLGRFLIGAGVSVGLMAGLKAMALWYPKERLPLMNSTILTVGIMGGISATWPLAFLAEIFPWQNIFFSLAGLALLIPLGLFLFSPEAQTRSMHQEGAALSMMQILCDQRFWSILPAAAMGMGSVTAMQSLWGGPWLLSEFGLSGAQTSQMLFVVMLVFGGSAFVIGRVAQRYQRQNGRLTTMMLWGCAMIVLGFSLMAFSTQKMSLAAYLEIATLPFALLGLILISVGANITFLSYAYASQVFGTASTAKANAVINLCVFGMAWIVQSMIGLILDLAGNPTGGYHIAFGLIAGVQFVVMLFVWVFRRA